MGDQPLLIALVAVQFMVHALGWAMAAQLTRRRRDAEGHFAAFWLLLAVGMMLYVPAWGSGSAPRNLGDLMIVAASTLQHRGMALYWGRRPNDRGYVLWMAFVAAMLALSLTQANGHGLRVANVCIGVGVMLLATVRLTWLQGRQQTPTFAAVLAIGYAVLGVALLARSVQALTVAPTTKISIDAPGHANVPLAILFLFLGGLINLALIRLVLGRVLEHLKTQALTDALTGAANRRGLLQRLEAVHARARQGGHGYVVMMVDIDHFKAINDEHGHAEGDIVLKRVAQHLRDGLRADDMVARWGGEEFCVLLPRIRLAEAHPLAERMTVQIAATGNPRVTVSIGVAEAEVQAEGPEGATHRADAALYRAKQTGRNRVVSASGLAPG